MRRVSNAKARFRKVQELCYNKKICEIGDVKMEGGADEDISIVRTKGGCGRAQPKTIKVCNLFYFLEFFSPFVG